MDSLKQIRYDRRRKIIDTIKLAVGCQDCGYNEYSGALQFDHIGEDKKLGVAVMWSYSIERHLDEIEKCEVVCANCHAVRTAERHNEKIKTKSS